MFGIRPQDEYLLYDEPIITQVMLAAGAQTVLCKPNLDRVVLILSGDTTNGTFAFPSQLTLTGGGLALGTGAPTVIMTAIQHGPLVQYGWTAQAGGPGSWITVTEIVTRIPPEMRGYRGVFHQIQATEPAANTPRRRGVGVFRGTRRPVALPAILRRRIPSLYGEE